jgi:hypothetical protein
MKPQILNKFTAAKWGWPLKTDSAALLPFNSKHAAKPCQILMA